MATPGRPRQSGIPTPGRVSSIPTPGRTRSSSNVHQNTQISEDVSRALEDAIKANDPSVYRNVSLADSTSTSSLSPPAVVYSGRRSVAGRPASAASTSSSKLQERAKTPSSARMVSRPSSRSDLHKSRDFVVGDNVRIESLGFEGTLRFLGDIEGKPGIWAGVELKGGFSGKGKNNGSVGGKQYFKCSDNCGVFVATSKLSLPTVGPSAVPRPSSVASFKGTNNIGLVNSRNSGRVTPSLISGSRTPSSSFSNGRIASSAGDRITPSTGRITPNTLIGHTQNRPYKTPTSKTNGQSLSDKITAGSRASKYMTMTAQQLSTRDRNPSLDKSTIQNTADVGPSRASPPISGSISSPSRLQGSPFTTPKPRSSATGDRSPTLLSNRGRASMSTPRARVPSGEAMPPPPSPKFIQSNNFPVNLGSTSSQSSHSASLYEEKTTSPFPLTSRPNSSTSFNSAGTDEIGIIEQMQSRLDAAEYEIDRLRTTGDANADNAMFARLENLRKELDDVTNNLTITEGKLLAANSLVTSQQLELQTCQRENQVLKQQLVDTTDRARRDGANQESAIHAQTLEIKSLEDNIKELEQLIKSKDEINLTQSSSFQELSATLEKAYKDFQDERKELFVQIDELRMAGQETIALYEERLSVADGQRYELEHRLITADANLKSLTTDKILQEPASSLNSATMIDNETLRDQVQHLQRKSVKLEEQLEETRATLERDISTYQEKISRMRMEEEQHKRDLNFKSREVEQLIQSESSARNRVEEIEEAFRESTVALEITRAEVEALRSEIANLDVLIDDVSEADMPSKLASFTRKMAADKSKYLEKSSHLEQELLQSRTENDRLKERLLTLAERPSDSSQSMDLLNAANESLRKQVAELEDKVLTLSRDVDSRSFEVDTTRKKINRDVPLLNGSSDIFNLNTGRYETAEELAGLKHIVQELQKENLASTQQIKLVESENRLLSTEADQLRQEIQLLKRSSVEVDQSNIENNRPNLSCTDQTTQYKTGMDQMRKRLNETEMKHARLIHDLNKEISELETLVEAKIYREDELEQEIERLKEKLARQKKTSKNNTESTDGRQRLSTASSTTGGTIGMGSREEDVCEICERPGHDIFNCSLLKDDQKAVVCEDCETPGHIAADCPHSLDVF